MIYDVIIIGLGASGVAASIYAKRSGLNVCVINYGVPGGIISTSSIVENYPGFKSISGMDLSIKFFEHFNSLDVPLYNEEVISIKSGLDVEVITKNNSYRAKNIIICSGRKPKKLGLVEEDKYMGKGVSYCATCDGALYKDKDVIVVGGGNSALENSLYLSNIVSSVTILVRKDKLIASKELIDEVSKKDNIKIEYETFIESINGEEVVNSVKTNKGIINTSAIFVNIGYEPSISILKELNLTMDNNYIVVDKDMRTSNPHVYAAGDIIKKDLYQLVTAISEGAIAADSVRNNMNK